MYIYLIRSSDNSNYKIGTTKNINKRIKELQTGNAEKLYVVDFYESINAFKIEKALHNFYINKKKLNEWFEFTIEDELNFKQLCYKIESNLNFLNKNRI